MPYEEPNIAASMTDDVGGDTNFPDFYFLYDILPMNDGVTYHVTLSHAVGDQSLMVTVYTNGQVYTALPYSYAESLADCRFDTLSIISYEQDDSVDAYMLLAHGTVTHFVAALPPVVRNLACVFSNAMAQVQCGTYQNWNYALERSTNLVAWCAITPA